MSINQLAIDPALLPLGDTSPAPTISGASTPTIGKRPAEDEPRTVVKKGKQKKHADVFGAINALTETIKADMESKRPAPARAVEDLMKEYGDDSDGDDNWIMAAAEFLQDETNASMYLSLARNKNFRTRWLRKKVRNKQGLDEEFD